MWIWIANKFAKFHAKKNLTEVKIFLKVLGGYFFETPCILNVWKDLLKPAARL